MDIGDLIIFNAKTSFYDNKERVTYNYSNKAGIIIGIESRDETQNNASLDGGEPHYRRFKIWSHGRILTITGTQTIKTYYKA